MKSSTDFDSQSHIYKHYLYTCSYWTCYWENCGERFNDRTALAEHAEIYHGLYLAQKSSHRYTWCRYCKVYVFGSKFSTLRKTHFEDHLEDALIQTKEYGYCDVFLHKEVGRPMEFIPPQCVFHLHDNTTYGEDRISRRIE